MDLRTFPHTRVPQQLHQAVVVRRDQHLVAEVGVHRVDVVDLRVLGPDAVHLGAQDAGPGGPLEQLQLLPVGDLLTPWGEEEPGSASSSHAVADLNWGYSYLVLVLYYGIVLDLNK